MGPGPSGTPSQKWPFTRALRPAPLLAVEKDSDACMARRLTTLLTCVAAALLVAPLPAAAATAIQLPLRRTRGLSQLAPPGPTVKFAPCNEVAELTCGGASAAPATAPGNATAAQDAICCNRVSSVRRASMEGCSRVQPHVLCADPSHGRVVLFWGALKQDRAVVKQA